ncbi:MAG: cation:proton antiporter, partial [Chloroflexota bacterium]
MIEWIYLLITFFLIAVAAKRIGQWFSKIGLPYITGYLLVGMFAGPFILNLLPQGTTTDLRFLDEIALAVIAFTAGSELYLKQIRKRLKSIGYISGGIILTALPLLGFGLFFLTEFIPFAQGMEFTSRLAIAILGATILLALSPASTIAVIKEARAQGDYTRTVLGVTVTMDVLIVVLFAVAVAIVGALLHSTGFSLLFIGILIIDLVAAIVIGGLIGYLLSAEMMTPLH